MNTQRRTFTQADLRLLADAITIEFPELQRRPHHELLDAWRRLAERHRIVVEERPAKRASLKGMSTP